MAYNIIKGSISNALSSSGADVGLTTSNTSNTASSTATLYATVAGTSAGDARVQYAVTGTTTWTQGIDNSDSDAYALAASSALGTTNVMRVSTAGEINYPLQPAFLAYLATSDSNVTGDGTAFQLGSGNALTEVFDQNGDFNTNGTFTAPVTGRYQLSTKWNVTGLTTAMTVGSLTTITSNRSGVFTLDPAKVFDNNTTMSYIFTALFDMDAADTAVTSLQISNGTKVASIQANATNLQTTFNGFLVC